MAAGGATPAGRGCRARGSGAGQRSGLAAAGGRRVRTEGQRGGAEVLVQPVPAGCRLLLAGVVCSAARPAVFDRILHSLSQTPGLMRGSGMNF